MKKYIIIAVVVLIGGLGIYTILRIRSQISQVETQDAIGQVLVSMDKTLGDSPLVNYNPAAEAKKAFPLIPHRDGHIIDAWNNAIVVSINQDGDSFHITITSAGPDGEMHTGDDLIRQGAIKARVSSGR